jgi:signal transduction histidine kinase
MLNQLLETMTTGTDIAARNLARAAELVTSFKQVAADQASSQRRSFALHEVTGEIVLTVRPLLRRSEVNIEVSVPQDIWFDSYPGPLGQVLTNLVSNAVTHAFEGRSERRICIEAEALASGRVGIRVADNGGGIAEDLLPRIFDPFVTTRMGRGGTGLGLHIAHNLVVQVLGGSIAVDSRPGEGSCFTIELPRKAPVAALPA